MLDLRLALPDDVQHLAVGDTPIKVKCPDSEHVARLGKVDKTQSLAVYPDHLHCYGCNLHIAYPGDPSLPTNRNALAVLLGTSSEEAEKAAFRYTAERLDAYRERAAVEARRDPLPMGLAAAYHAILTAERASRQPFLLGRGLTGKTLEKALIGHNGFQYTIPVFAASGDLLTIRLRRDDEYGTKRPKYMGLPGRNGLYLYGEKWLAKAKRTQQVVITEGELDALLLWQEGIAAVSATNGARQAEKVPALIRELRPDITHLVIATDQDEPGAAAAEQTIRAATALGFTTKRATWSEAKDVSEFYTTNPQGFRQCFGLAA